MLATSAAFATLVTGAEYYGAWRVQIALPAAASAYDDVTLTVSQVECGGDTTTDQPEGSRMQVGLPSLRCSFTVAGLVDRTDESKTAEWLFSPYSTTSPLYHSDALYSVVTVDFGVYTSTSAGTPEYVRKFTGVVDSYEVNEDGSVSFVCVDGMRSRLRSVPASPPVITAPPYNAGLTSEFAVDALLRAATKQAVSSWPAQRSQCVLAVGMRTSLWPELGAIDTTVIPSGYQFAPGVNGSALAAPIVVSPLRWTLAAPIGATVFIECWVTISGAGVAVALIRGGSVDHFGLDIDPTVGVRAKMQLNGSPYVFSTATGAITGEHYVAVAATLPAVGASTATGTIYIDNSSTAFSITTVGSRSSFSWSSLELVSDTTNLIEALQVTTESSPTPNNGFVPQAVLDPSLNPLTVVPAVDAGDPWQVIQQIADAELGVAGGDESGIFRFYNRNTLRGVTSQRDITSASSLTGLGSQETTAAGVINHCTVEYTPWDFAATRSTVWSAAAPLKVAKRSTRVIKARSEGLFANLDTGLSNLSDGSGDTANSHYRASIDKYGTAEHPGGFTITVTQSDSQTALVTVTNPTAQDAWFVSPANYVDLTVGTPLLRLAALVVTQSDALVADFAYPPDPSTTRFGEQATQVSGNQWIQDDDTALDLTTDIVVDQCVPRPNLTSVSIVPDPRIQLTDVVHLIDPDRTGVDEYARVFGWTITWEASSEPGGEMTYDMTLDARTLAPPGGWLMGVTGRSEIGSTAYVYSGA